MPRTQQVSGLCDSVRRHCAAVAGRAQSVAIDIDALDGIGPGPPPTMDPLHHYVDGPPDAVADYLLCLDTINFGSGWFPTLRKRPGCSGYLTVAAALADQWRGQGGWTGAELEAMTATRVASVLGQNPNHELMALYAQALRQLGAFLGARRALDLVGEAQGSAERLAGMLGAGMSMFADHGFYKRAQIVPADLDLAGVAAFDDLDRLTIFADNVVPHVLHCDGALRYDPRLAAHIDAGRPVRPGPQEREIRACAVHACELLSQRLAVPARTVDHWLWNRGQEPAYKARPRHRCRSVWY